MERFHPYEELGADPGVTLVFLDLPHGVRGFLVDRPDGTATIVVNRSLGWVERRATVTHEMRHRKRGVCGCRRIDERGIDDEVARLLIPDDDINAMFDIAVTNDLTVEVHQVADRYDVPERVARRRMQQVIDERGRNNGSGFEAAS